ncbi:MAG: PEGA domain-containing protein, partial [Bradymonadaceae bacterium]
TRPMRIPRPSTVLKVGDLKLSGKSSAGASSAARPKADRSGDVDPAATAVLQKAETRKITLPTNDADIAETIQDTVKMDALLGGHPDSSAKRDPASSSESLPISTPNSSAEINARVDRSQERVSPGSISNEFDADLPDLSSELEAISVAEDELESIDDDFHSIEVVDDGSFDFPAFKQESSNKKKMPLIIGVVGAVFFLVFMIVIFSGPSEEIVPDDETTIAGQEKPHEEIEPEIIAEKEPLDENSDGFNEFEADWLNELEDDRIIPVRTQPKGVRISVNESDLGETPLELAVKDLEFPTVVKATYRGISQEKTLTGAVDELVFEFAEPEPSPKTASDTSRKTTKEVSSGTKEKKRKFQYRPVDQVD